MDMIDREVAKTLHLNTPTNKKDIKLCGEMMRDVGGVYFDGVDLKLLHKLKQKYTSNKYCMSELIEELTNIINAKSGLEKEVQELEKEVQELRKENEDLDIELGRIPHLKEYGRDLEKEVEILKFHLQKDRETYQQIVRDIEGVCFDDVSLRWNVGEEV